MSEPFDFPVIKDDVISDNLKVLNDVNFQIAELSRIKEELEARVSALLEHGEDASKTYTHGKFKVTVSTGYNYSLNKDEYEILQSIVPDEFNPVLKRVAYDLDKSVLRDIEKYAGDNELALISQFISKKPKKLHVKLTAGV